MIDQRINITNCIIFSKDRAMQVDATLHSFFLHCTDVSETARLTVLYKASNSCHLSQYQQLQSAYPNVRFVAENNFREDVLGLLNPYPQNSFASLLYRFVAIINSTGFRPGNRSDHLIRLAVDPFRFWVARSLFSSLKQLSAILFLVDDNLFVRDFSLTSCIEHLNSHTDALGFSLRLGRNTTYNYMADCPQFLPRFSELPPNTLKFDWTDANLDFGYPLEVSSSIYLNTVIIPLLLTIAFRNPNWLESALSLRTGLFRQSHPSMLCLEQSATFCNPANVVQSTQANRAGVKQTFSVEELMERFERGERIDVTAYNGFVPNACHQEVELHFDRTEKP